MILSQLFQASFSSGVSQPRVRNFRNFPHVHFFDLLEEPPETISKIPTNSPRSGFLIGFTYSMDSMVIDPAKFTHLP